jgi:hypothetical protein
MQALKLQYLSLSISAVVFALSLQIINLEYNTEHMDCSVGIHLKVLLLFQYV